MGLSPWKVTELVPASPGQNAERQYEDKISDKS